MKKLSFVWMLWCIIAVSAYGQKSHTAKTSKRSVVSERFVHVIPENGDECCSPYFFIKSNDPLKSWMPLSSTSAEVTITGNIANVKVEQIYVNQSKQNLDAIYIFPGSTRAAVYGLDMTIGQRTLHAKVKEKEEARKDFEKAKQQGKKATLLEQDRPNVFKMEVSNIAPGETIKVEMFYTELLEYREKVYEFTYPTAVGPRYSTQNEEFVEKSIKQLMSTHKPSFNINVTIDGAIPVQSVASPSHPVMINKLSETATRISLNNPSDEQTGKDFILRYSLQGNALESGLTLYEKDGEQYFLLMLQPPKSTAQKDILPREYIFIVDVSGSMSGFPLEVSKTILRKLISSLRPTDRFNVLLFESCRAMLSDVSLPATPENIEKAIGVIDKQPGSGGTELYPALQTAFAYNDPASKEYARTFIIATDGFITIENKAFKLISENLDKANFFPLGIGNNPNRYLIEGMAWAGASEPYIINNLTAADSIGQHLIQTISQPLLSHIQIDWGDFEAYDTYPQKIPDVFSERPIIVYGKYKGSPQGSIRLQGQTAQGDFIQEIPVARATRSDNEALRYLWARNKIRYLSDYASYFEDNVRVFYRSSTREDKYKKEIIDLGLKYNLLTAYTSFLAIDDKNTQENINETTSSKSVEVKSCEDMAISIPIIKESKAEADAEAPALYMAESMPAFAGGDKNLSSFIHENLKYPAIDLECGTQGLVVVRFIVNENGEIGDIKVIRSLSPTCDQEAIRIVKSMPKWIPAKQNGKAVAVYYTLPVRFQLEH